MSRPIAGATPIEDDALAALRLQGGATLFLPVRILAAHAPLGDHRVSLVVRDDAPEQVRIGGTSVASTCDPEALPDRPSSTQRLVLLHGRVATRPRGLNPVGTEPFGARIPVFLDEERVGVAISQQYPVAGETEAVFRAVLDVQQLPPELRDQEAIPFAGCEQGRGFPGPAVERILL